MRSRTLLPLALGLGLAFSLACAGELPGGSTEAPSQPRAFQVEGIDTHPVPNWRVENLRVDDSCATMLDYCVGVSCDIVSAGGDSASSTATLALEQDGGALQDHQALTLSGGQRQSVRHEFKEARPFGSTPSGSCSFAQEGTQVVCSVRNLGGAGTQKVEAQLIFKDGSDQVQSKAPNLAAGESREVRILFQGVDYGRVLRAECEAR